MSRKQRQTGTRQEMEPIKHEKEIEMNNNNKPISTEIQATNLYFHAMKFKNLFRKYNHHV
jgi:hypothetical protein